MRTRLLLTAVAAVLPSAARAQEVAPPVPPAAPPAPPAAVVIESPLPTGPWSGPTNEPVIGLDLMLGQMTGIRPSLAVFRSERSAVVVEGFYGAVLTRLGQSEGAGAGVRWNLTRGGRDSVTFGPGADVLFNFRDGGAAILAPTVDLSWRREFGERVGSVLGINAGVGVGIGGRQDRGGDSAVGQVTPLISVFGGLRF